MEDSNALSVSAERIHEHLERLTKIRHPNKGPVGLAEAADYIRKQLCNSGAAVSNQSFKVKGFVGELCNIEGVINVNEEQEEWIVSAHYDTVCDSPGADDNASGVAVMLEAARVLAQNGTGRTIRFIGFNLEEGSPVEGDDRRFIGSRCWVGCAEARGIVPRGVVNLESVGYTGESQCFPPSLDLDRLKKHDIDQDRLCGNFIAILSDKASQRLGDVCFNQCCAVDLPAIFADMPLDVDQIRQCFPDLARADHVPFWERGIPAITLTDTANLRTRHYHTKDDTADKLDLEFAAKVCRATVRTVLHA